MDVVILGRIGYDLYSEEPHVPLPQARRFSRYLGGSSANMAVGLARLGARTGIVSCLGNDSLSRFLIEFLNQENVDTSHVQIAPGFLPSLAITEVSPPNSFPQVFYRHDAVDTQLDATAADLDYVAGAGMFVTNGTSLCCSPSRESTYRALERAKQAGCRVVFDVDYRPMSWRSRRGRAGGAARAAVHRYPDRQPDRVDAGGRRERSRSRVEEAAPGGRADSRLETGGDRNARLDGRRFGIPAALCRGRGLHDRRG